jgi:DNA-binding HxlR family transcriptional regulator
MLKTRKRYDCANGCPVEATLDLIGGKWKGVILFHLLSGTLRFNQMRKQIPSATQRMLTLQLRELEEAGLVRRHVYPQVPPRVEYSLTDEGRSLEPLLHFMQAWGKKRIAQMQMAQRHVA